MINDLSQLYGSGSDFTTDLASLIARSLILNHQVIEARKKQGQEASAAGCIKDLLRSVPLSPCAIEILQAKGLYDPQHSVHAYLWFAVEDLDFYIVRNDRITSNAWKILAVYRQGERRHLVTSHDFTGWNDSGEELLHQDAGIYAFIGQSLAALPDFCERLNSVWEWPENFVLNLTELYWEQGQKWQRGWTTATNLNARSEFLVYFMGDVFWKKAYLSSPLNCGLSVFKRYEIRSEKDLVISAGELIMPVSTEERQLRLNIAFLGRPESNPYGLGAFAFDREKSQVEPVFWLKDYLQSCGKDEKTPLPPDSTLIDGALGFAKEEK
jgi:hypothetical protein